MRQLLSLSALSLLAACGGAPDPSTSASSGPASSSTRTANPGEIDVAGLAAAMEAGTVNLVDVRTPDEYASGHVPGAISIPLPELEARLAELEAWKNEEIHLICATGRRSSAAQEVLVGKGFTRTVNVSGGTSGWQRAGNPVEQ